MKVGKVLLLSLVGGAAIAMVTAIGLRPHRGERRATVAETAEKTAVWSAPVDRSDPPDPSAGVHSIAESPAERERTLQARRMLAVALAMGAARRKASRQQRSSIPEQRRRRSPSRIPTRTGVGSSMRSSLGERDGRLDAVRAQRVLRYQEVRLRRPGP